MFEDKKITKEKVKDLLYALQCEFDNEIDGFEYNDRELTNDDLDMISYAIGCYVDKAYMVIDDELED